jgi:hypothetical protein
VVYRQIVRDTVEPRLEGYAPELIPGQVSDHTSEHLTGQIFGQVWIAQTRPQIAKDAGVMPIIQLANRFHISSLSAFYKNQVVCVRHQSSLHRNVES